MKLFYKCLPQRIYQNGEYTIEAVQPHHIERIRQLRNEQMDLLRQENPISKEEQIQYYEKYIWPELKSDNPKNILLSYKYKDELIGYGGLPALVNFNIPVDNWLKYKTLITQEMLKKGFLAANSVYVCTEHTNEIIDEYFEYLDPVIATVSDCENGRNVDVLLEGPVCHSGFKRLN